jgi:predicted cupin superfamily sugar epimerase
MGSDPSKGEVTQLFVPGGWWKASEMPEGDLKLLDVEDAGDLKERLGCLISEVVVPGWTPEQHQFLTEEKVCFLSAHHKLN